jgi:hypothetical protein
VPNRLRKEQDGCSHVSDDRYLLSCNLAIVSDLTIFESEPSSITATGHLPSCPTIESPEAKFTCIEEQVITILELFSTLPFTTTLTHLSHLPFKLAIYTRP